MSNATDLYDDALQSYQASRYREASLLFRSAASAALEVGDQRRWFAYTIRAADAHGQADDYMPALSLLLAAREAQPTDADEYDVRIGRKLTFYLTASTRPQLRRLENIAEDLRSVACEAESAAVQARILELRGNWLDALTRYEAAWQLHSGKGSIKSSIGFDAAWMCLKLGRPAACRDWIEAAAKCDSDWSYTPRVAAWLTLEVARFEHAPYEQLLRLFRTYEDHLVMVQGAGVSQALFDFTARILLQDPNGGDPQDLFHPSRGALRHGRRSANVHDQYSSRLLFLDYRLACVRFAANIPQSDDEFFNADAVPQAIDYSSELGRRIEKARVASNWALAKARQLDTWLECDWRVGEITERRRRIEQIARAFDA